MYDLQSQAQGQKTGKMFDGYGYQGLWDKYPLAKTKIKVLEEDFVSKILDVLKGHGEQN